MQLRIKAEDVALGHGTRNNQGQGHRAMGTTAGGGKKKRPLAVSPSGAKTCADKSPGIGRVRRGANPFNCLIVHLSENMKRRGANPFYCLTVHLSENIYGKKGSYSILLFDCPPIRKYRKNGSYFTLCDCPLIRRYGKKIKQII